MRILVTGANGFLGRAITRAGGEAGHHVIATSRQGVALAGASEMRATGDLVESASSLDFSGVDAVVHCAARVHVTAREDPGAAQAAYDTHNARLPVALAQAARDAGVRSFVQISSVAAIASATPPGSALDDSAEPAPASPYGAAKLAADRALADLASDAFTVVSLRPPAIYGPRVGAWFALLMRAARAGLPLPIGAIDNRRSFAFVDNVASAALAATRMVQSGAFIVSDSLPISTAALYRKLVGGHGKQARIWRWPRPAIAVPARLLLGDRAQSMLGNAAFDGHRFAALAGWEPEVTMEEALRLTIAAG
ncbi:NAD-dependent epimerase/dehydratase family protein [Qipengyuania nanhaisediminis]|uniref:NAD-dependent epimerase/dehydratase family protein n=1 Tax=Qipengyuania nanhaisediminis TaxID=604088 RepID=UPI0038B26AC4